MTDLVSENTTAVGFLENAQFTADTVYAPPSSKEFAVSFVHTECAVPINDQLLWMDAWIATFNESAKYPDAAFWEICSFRNVSIVSMEGADCLRYDCSNGTSLIFSSPPSKITVPDRRFLH